MNSDRPSNPGIAYLLKVRRLEALLIERNAEIALLKQENKALISGINLRGWWCLAPCDKSLSKTCDMFNGEEHSIRTHCRRCNTEKTSIPMQTLSKVSSTH